MEAATRRSETVAGREREEFGNGGGGGGGGSRVCWDWEVFDCEVFQGLVCAF